MQPALFQQALECHLGSRDERLDQELAPRGAAVGDVLALKQASDAPERGDDGMFAQFSRALRSSRLVG